MEVGHFNLKGILGLRNSRNDCYFNSILHVFMGLTEDINIKGWNMTTLPEFKEHSDCLKLIQYILYCSCSNKFNLVYNLKIHLSKHNSIFGNTEQQDCLEAFNAICDILDKATHIPLYFNDLYTSSIKDNFVGIMSTKTTCNQCGHISFCDTEYREIYIPIHSSILDALSESNNFTRIQFCNRCNKDMVHKCHNNFITNPKILVLVVKRFDNNMHKLTTVLQGSTTLVINNQNYKLKCLIEHHGETIHSGHYTATIEEDNRWISCNDLIIKPTKIQKHLVNGYMLFYVHT